MGKTSIGTPARPKGRSLSDFEPLRPDERKLLRACAYGSHPGRGAVGPFRAGFIRFLLLGGDEQAPVHEEGVKLVGADIEGLLDFSGCMVPNPIMLIDCRFDDGIRCRDTSVVSLALSGSKVKFLDAERMRCAGEVRLNNRFTARESVDLNRSILHGDLYFDAAVLSGGGVRPALDLSKTRVGGTVYFSDRFRADTTVRLARAQIGGNLVIYNAEFRAGGLSNFAIEAHELEVGGTLIFRPSVVEGGISVANARANALNDAAGSWSPPLVLDGFVYDRLVEAPTAARMRIPWLLMQEANGAPFVPQPWEHLYRVLRDSGHGREATRVAMAKQRQRRLRGLVGHRETRKVPFLVGVTNRFLNQLERIAHRLYGAVAGYGHRKVQGALLAALTVWLAAAALFAVGNGYFGPSDNSLVAKREQWHCGYSGEPGKRPWTQCPSIPPEYARFQPLMYSADLILPFLDLQQERYWAPIVADQTGGPLERGRLLRVLMWMEILFGWGVVGYLVSLIGKLASREPVG
ncbi:MAG TPA: hypothetical protein VF782_02405 [Allosphingosinicella sp.]